jgi:hypothetical protein
VLHEIAFFVLAKAQFEMVRLNSILVSHGGCAEKREKIRKKSKNKNPKYNGLLPCF